MFSFFVMLQRKKRKDKYQKFGSKSVIQFNSYLVPDVRGKTEDHMKYLNFKKTETALRRANERRPNNMDRLKYKKLSADDGKQ